MYGKWVVKEFAVYDPENGFVMKSVEEILASDDPMLEDYKQMANSLLILSEDGTANTYVAIPDEMIEEAKAEGATVTEYGVLVESKELKVENGEFYFNTGDSGEVLGEAVDPFVKLELDGEGCLMLNPMVKYKKAE